MTDHNTREQTTAQHVKAKVAKSRTQSVFILSSEFQMQINFNPRLIYVYLKPIFKLT